MISPKLTDDQFIDCGIAAYCRWQNRTGQILEQPSRTASYVERHGAEVLIVLANVRGELARYRIGTRGLVRVKGDDA